MLFEADKQGATISYSLAVQLISYNQIFVDASSNPNPCGPGKGLEVVTIFTASEMQRTPENITSLNIQPQIR